MSNTERALIEIYRGIKNDYVAKCDQQESEVTTIKLTAEELEEANRSIIVGWRRVIDRIDYLI